MEGFISLVSWKEEGGFAENLCYRFSQSSSKIFLMKLISFVSMHYNLMP